MTELPKGVYVSGKKFVARIRHATQLIHLGTFSTIVEASEAVLAKQLELGTTGNNTKPRIKKENTTNE